MITIFALEGIGEVRAGADLAELIITAAGSQLRDGDIVVVTSKIISKTQGRTAPAPNRGQVIEDETVRTVARRGDTAIVRDRRGLILAAAGVDNSNVTPDQILLLPPDPDAAAADLRAELRRRTGLDLGVVVSDTAGRPWRVGQTDQAIGAAGVPVLWDYRGGHDGYGNELRVTETAIADELAAAADLVKGKVDGRPVAVVRGLVRSPSNPAAAQPADLAARLQRPASQDWFTFGSQEAVLAALLKATGQPDRYEALVRLPAGERAGTLLAGATLDDGASDLVRALLAVDLAAVSSDLEDTRPLSDPG